MITLPRKQVTPPPVPEPLAPVAPIVMPPEVVVDTTQIAELVRQQQEQITALAARMDESILQLTEAVRRLEPGQGFSVTVTEWNNQGRIKTLKIVKE